MVLTNLPRDPILDLDPWVGQRKATYRFHLFNGVTGQNKGDITPIRGARLSHDSTRTLVRRLNLSLGVQDAALIDPITDRVAVYMVFATREFPLGVYMFSDEAKLRFTSGLLSNLVLNDEMFLVDQQILEGINGNSFPVGQLIPAILKDLPVTFNIESSPFQAANSWTIGTRRGVICDALAVAGDYFNPWFNNENTMKWIRTFNPADKIPDFDFDTGRKVIRSSIVETSDLISAPNFFVVISNNPDDFTNPVVATATVSPAAPNSIQNRGFTIAATYDLQLSNLDQAQVVVNGLAQRNTIFERVNLSTAPDPRHDGYNVIRWQGANWLELGWDLRLVEGSEMGHTLRKAYTG